MPNNGRFQILDSGRTLRISQVTRADRDTYTCSAESAAGRMQAFAELSILSEGILFPHCTWISSLFSVL